MLKSELNQLSYVKHSMFKEELKNMLIRDLCLDPNNPFLYKEIIVSRAKPPIVSTEIKEVYICYPVDADPFEINIRNIMIEQEAINRIQVISDIKFPKDFIWPVIGDKEAHIMKEMNCFTGKKHSKWNLAAIDDQKSFHFSDNFYLACRADFKGKQSEIVQFSDFDPYRIVEYMINDESFEHNLDDLEKAKWRSNTKPQYSLKKGPNGIYKLY